MQTVICAEDGGTETADFQVPSNCVILCDIGENEGYIYFLYIFRCNKIVLLRAGKYSLKRRRYTLIIHGNIILSRNLPTK